MTPEGPRKEVLNPMSKTNTPSCMPEEEAGVTNPEARTPCKNQPNPDLKEGRNLLPVFTQYKTPGGLQRVSLTNKERLRLWYASAK